MIAVHPRRSLELLTPEVASLNGAIMALGGDQWQRPSNCGGWQVADLVAHVVRNGWSMLTFAQRALAGDPTPSFGAAVAHIQEEIKASGARAAAERQAREHEQFASLIGGLPDADLDKLAAHPAGQRPIAWACSQRLAEVAFHYWDLRRSLGHDGPLDADLASYLLPFMLDPAQTSIMVSAMPQGAPAETIRLTSTTDGSAWRVTASPDGRVVEADPSGPVALSLTAEAGWLALALYGRVKPDAAPFSLEGPPDAAQRFVAAFGG
jgi:uncharacterized protein (TIGR03083 family)